MAQVKKQSARAEKKQLKPYDDFYAFLREASAQPQSVQGQFNIRTNMYRRLLLRRILSIYSLEGAPEEWDTNYFFRNLFLNGYVTITDTPVGIIPIWGTLNGYNVFGNPTDVEISSAVFTETLQKKIGKDCVVIWLDNTAPVGNFAYGNVVYLVNVFAEKLASCDAGIDVNVMNSKVAVVFKCTSEAQANTAKAMYDSITSGEPAVFMEEDKVSNLVTKDGFQPFYNNVKNSYVADMLQDTKRAIMGEFLTIIGLNNNPVEKKERLVTGEVSSNNEEIYNSIWDWTHNIELGLQKANKMFGLSLSLKLNVDDIRKAANVEGSDISGRNTAQQGID